MNVYDFDGTICPTDCSIGFFFWCLKGHDFSIRDHHQRHPAHQGSRLTKPDDNLNLTEV